MEDSAEFHVLLKHCRYRTMNPVTKKRLTQAQCVEQLETLFGVSGYTKTQWGYWERGEREIPHAERALLIGIIKLLHHYNGLSDLDEAERLLAAGHYRQLNAREIETINPLWLSEITPHPSSTDTPPIEWQTRIVQSWITYTDEVTPTRLLHTIGWLTLYLILSFALAPLHDWQFDVQAFVFFGFALLVVPIGVTALTDNAQTPQRHFVSRLSYARIGLISVMFPFILLSYFYPALSGSLLPRWIFFPTIVTALILSHSLISFSATYKSIPLLVHASIVVTPLTTMLTALFHYGVGNFGNRYIAVLFGLGFVAVLIGIKKVRQPEIMSDIAAILLLGLLFPSTVFILAIPGSREFVTPQYDPFPNFVLLTDALALLFLAYLFPLIPLFITIRLRQTTRISLWSLLYLAGVANGADWLDSYVSSTAGLLLLSIFLVGWLFLRRSPRFACQIHYSLLAYGILITISVWFQRQYPEWVTQNTVVTGLIAIGIITYAYRDVSANPSFEISY